MVEIVSVSFPCTRDSLQKCRIPGQAQRTGFGNALRATLSLLSKWPVMRRYVLLLLLFVCCVVAQSNKAAALVDREFVGELHCLKFAFNVGGGFFSGNEAFNFWYFPLWKMSNKFLFNKYLWFVWLFPAGSQFKAQRFLAHLNVHFTH